jgi:hypothetical protein
VKFYLTCTVTCLTTSKERELGGNSTLFEAARPDIFTAALFVILVCAKNLEIKGLFICSCPWLD